jgi:hypothetical protein
MSTSRLCESQEDVEGFVNGFYGTIVGILFSLARMYFFNSTSFGTFFFEFLLIGLFLIVITRVLIDLRCSVGFRQSMINIATISFWFAFSYWFVDIASSVVSS